MNDLWKNLLTENILVRGWHLARLDTRQDFAEDLYSSDIFGVDLSTRIKETISRLNTETYQPRSILHLEVPKGSLGFRPGSVIPIQDRIIVSAIVLLMAEEIDNLFPPSVHSWRTKKPFPKKGPIFREIGMTEIPFLKKKSIRRAVDPFKSWYDIWPIFDKESRRIFEVERFRFLAISDIAAYFENIQLPILRDQLLQYFPNEPKLVNLLFLFLESWAVRTSYGRIHLRGIPQGNFVSSFLGNLFLLPLDNKFKKFEEQNEVRYFRYMDDVRVFTRKLEDARLAVFTMDRELRRLHLNVQTAKTKILDNLAGEIANEFIDERVDELTLIIDDINNNWKKDDIPEGEKQKYLRSLERISKKDIRKRQKLVGSRRPLDGLSVRAFVRWIYAHRLLNSDIYVDRLLKEIQINPDFKITQRLIKTAQDFPQKKKIESYLFRFIKSKQNIFSHQEAECLRAIRYLSNIHDDIIIHCKERLLNQEKDPYLRMQSAYLLSRIEMDLDFLLKLENLIDKENNPYVQVAISTVLVQKRHKNEEMIRKLVFHPNEKVSNIGKLYKTTMSNEPIAIKCLKHIFRSHSQWLLCDNIPYLHLMSYSDNIKIKKHLLNTIREPRNKHSIIGLRKILKGIFTRTRESLKR